jgi:hypothetical protein
MPVHEFPPIVLAGTSGLDVSDIIIRASRSYIEQLLRPRIEAGDGVALLDALDFCARAGMAMPAWLGEAYSARYVDWATFRKPTLDAAFGATRKGVHVKARARRALLMPRIVLAAMRLHEQEGLPYDDALFERVGKELRVDDAKHLFYAPDNPWRGVVKALLKSNPELLKTTR